ncbi:uncharacterized protein C10orf105 homolog [Bombina bombina]|uniref:uncharacterized protein C10orf105 homolog n=1 Tax=Bombina bombina TaxID=8345 RepID=UPI00235A69E7|nr:uncharacterized protein C10orf105 homolog [Bombina bombina]
MSSEDAAKITNDTVVGTGVFSFYNTTMESVPLNVTDIASEVTDPLPIIISLVCIFLLLATCLIFVTLCKPAALDQSLYGPRECMPYHVEDATEPQLRLWKRLGSLRQSIRSFRRNRPISLRQSTCPRRPTTTQDGSFMESTKM